MDVLPDLVRHWAECDPDRPALVDAVRTVTYGELDARTDRLARALRATGVGPGGRVGFLGRNAVEFWETWFGAAKAGCALAPFNWRSPAAELAEVVDDARVAVLVVEADLADTATQVRDRAASPPLLVVVGGTADHEVGYERWLGTHDAVDLDEPVDPSAAVLLAYTSGTTGRPKAARHTHRGVAAWFALAADDPDDTWSADDVALMVMPNFHLAGSWVSLPALYHGATIVIVPAFEPGTVLDAIARHGVTVTCLVPTAMAALLDDPRLEDNDRSSLRRVLYAGSPIAAETMVRARRLLGCDLLQFYGTTETYIISLLRPAQHDPDRPELLGSCGAPVRGVEVRLVEPGGDDPVPRGAVGEVLVRSPMLFDGYLDRPEATAEVMAEGWYRTGDLARRDGDGNLYLVDRVKDMIVSGGENVYSTEVERALGSHPEVAAVAVVGEPDPRWGERVVAFVVPRPGAEPVVEALLDHCRALIAGYKVPKVVHLLDALPTTPSGKVRKADLAARLAEGAA